MIIRAQVVQVNWKLPEGEESWRNPNSTTDLSAFNMPQHQYKAKLWPVRTYSWEPDADTTSGKYAIA